ncbi:hypothetical protein TL16_g07896 [Triparma laevis f. inornata]|uniref:Ankyrin repeat protein n=1 Tax=Triparma laevis f. inornata TaxID=1714386 RepID=A0A9W7AUQ3_9STRA|nr:hypothetical protein TL16_g07896 [Triparma laevis f. inornata]
MCRSRSSHVYLYLISVTNSTQNRSREDWNLEKGEKWTVSEDDNRTRGGKGGGSKKEENSTLNKTNNSNPDNSKEHIGALVAQCLLTSDKSSINQVDGNKYGALHYAVKKNDTVFLEALIKFGPDLDLKDGAGRTAVIIAAGENYNDCLEMLLKAGASVDARFPNKPRGSLLNFYSKRGLARQVTMCIQYEAKDVVNDDGETALTMAIGGERLCKIEKKKEGRKNGFELAVEALKSAGFKTSSEMAVERDLAGIRVGEREGGGEEEEEKEGGGERWRGVAEDSPKKRGFLCFGGKKKKVEKKAVEETKEEEKEESTIEEKKEEETKED